MPDPQTQARTTSRDRKAEPALTLTRSFKASLERVYGAFADSVQLARWFGPQGCSIADCDWTPEVGRPWRVVIVHADGDANPVGGVFREVVPGARLVLTWAWENTQYAGLETLVTLEFKALGDMTELTLTHEWLADDLARERHAKGWSSSFKCLAELLA
ncbi:MAG: SRPBCC domain-containing protein [Kiloniellales bacterium]|nr:SRPBCC domain-containing protein [Kiloniellales bacterium]